MDHRTIATCNRQNRNGIHTVNMHSTTQFDGISVDGSWGITSLDKLMFCNIVEREHCKSAYHPQCAEQDQHEHAMSHTTHLALADTHGWRHVRLPGAVRLRYQSRPVRATDIALGLPLGAPPRCWPTLLQLGGRRHGFSATPSAARLHLTRWGRRRGVRLVPGGCRPRLAGGASHWCMVFARCAMAAAAAAGVVPAGWEGGHGKGSPLCRRPPTS